MVLWQERLLPFAEMKRDLADFSVSLNLLFMTK